MAALAALALACATALAQQPQPMKLEDMREGVHYETLQSPGKYNPSAPGVEVAEVFLYTCPFCSNLHPMLDSLRQQLPEGARFLSVPAIFGDAQNRHAQLYHGLELIGADDSAHIAVFNSIHKGRIPMTGDRDIANMARSRGLDGDKLLRAMKSLRVRSQTARSKLMVRRWKITGVPSFVVDGRYKLTATRRNRFGHETLLEATAVVAQAVADGRL